MSGNCDRCNRIGNLNDFRCCQYCGRQTCVNCTVCEGGDIDDFCVGCIPKRVADKTRKDSIKAVSDQMGKALAMFKEKGLATGGVEAFVGYFLTWLENYDVN